MARRKNTRRFDPRYFMDEKREVLRESLVDTIISIIANSPLPDMDTPELHYAVKKQMPQLSDDEIDAAMNDPRLNDYYDPMEDVWAKKSLNEKADDNEGTLREPFAGLVRHHAEKAIKIIDRGLAKDDDPEHLKILREAFENILEYDKNEMADYLNDWAEHIKTPRLRQQLTSMALVFEHSQGI